MADVLIFCKRKSLKIKLQYPGRDFKYSNISQLRALQLLLLDPDETQSVTRKFYQECVWRISLVFHFSSTITNCVIQSKVLCVMKHFIFTI